MSKLHWSSHFCFEVPKSSRKGAAGLIAKKKSKSNGSKTKTTQEKQVYPQTNTHAAGGQESYGTLTSPLSHRRCGRTLACSSKRSSTSCARKAAIMATPTRMYTHANSFVAGLWALRSPYPTVVSVTAEREGGGENREKPKNREEAFDRHVPRFLTT